MEWTPEQEQEDQALVIVSKTAKPLSRPSATSQQQKQKERAFFCTVRNAWNWLRGYTAEDVAKLKEAGIQKLQGEGLKPLAEARAKVGEAAERHANAEKLRAEAEKAKAEADAIRRKADGEYAKDISIAVQNVADAMSKIKQAGGTVAFDEQQLLKLLTEGQKRFPEDRQIAAGA